MTSFPRLLGDRLADLDHQSLRRSLRFPQGKDFTSNDYLGFAADPVLRTRFLGALADLPVGASASRLLRGQLPAHAETEAALARFVRRDAALLYPSGYQANVGLLSALLRAGDVAFSDELNHASIIDGLRLGRAHRYVYAHNDPSSLRPLLERHGRGSGLKLIVTESLFSMEGDQAPLTQLADLAAEFGALLVVDEAHATGLFGDAASRLGGGLVQQLGLNDRVFASVHTGGKALGAAGAWIAGDASLKEYLTNFSRPFIYSTAALPAMALLLSLSVEHWGQVGAARAEALLDHACSFRAALARLADCPGVRVPSVSGPIIPVILGDNERPIAVARRLQEAGFDVRAIRPPTVPAGTARLRVTVTWPRSAGDLDDLADALFSIVGR